MKQRFNTLLDGKWLKPVLKIILWSLDIVFITIPLTILSIVFNYIKQVYNNWFVDNTLYSVSFVIYGMTSTDQCFTFIEQQLGPYCCITSHEVTQHGPLDIDPFKAEYLITFYYYRIDYFYFNCLLVFLKIKMFVLRCLSMK